MSLDFARARRNPFFSLLALDKVEDSLLPFRQHTFRIAHDSSNASSDEQIMLLNAFLAFVTSGSPASELCRHFAARLREPALDASLFIELIARFLSRRDRVLQLTRCCRVHETPTQVSDNTRGRLPCRR